MVETVAGVRDANNRSALQFAAREGKDEVCRYLVEELKLSHVVDAKDDDGDTPLIHAAIYFDPTDGVLLSNRSLCWLRLGQAEQALADAKACRALKSNWLKACYREGAALLLLQRFDEAANAFYEGVQLDPENKELVAALREAVE